MRINLEFSRQTADNYRAIYERRDDPKMLTVSNLNDVYKDVLGIKPEKKQDVKLLEGRKVNDKNITEVTEEMKK